MRASISLAVVASVVIGHAQAPPSSPAFEVASVKPANREVLRQRSFACSFLGPEHFVGLGTAQWLIACAYGIKQMRAPQEILGGPGWLNRDLFEIDAVLPRGNRPTFGPGGLVPLQALLADRLKLKVHRDATTQPTYSLVLARSDGNPGPRLRPATPECVAWIANGRRGQPPRVAGDVPCGLQRQSASTLHGSATTMARLADFLSSHAGRPVQDRTGLTGNFDFTLAWSPQARPLAAPDPARPPFVETSGPTLFDALEQQLGLKLMSTTAPVEVVVIDHIERPTPD
jgi:uncharacterized protein (TIGR03435 family)